MKLFFHLLVCGYCLACNKKDTAVYVPPPVFTAVKSWLALGDSYTIGQSVPVGDRFPNQTTSWLRQNGISINTPDYIATTGWTTTVLMNNIQAQNPGHYDVVSLLIGVNDEYQLHDTTGYRQRFAGLLDISVRIANGKKGNVFVLSIPDYSVTPYASGSDTARIRREIDMFNAINREVTLAYGCPYLDITPSTRLARYDPSLIAIDGLHPSGLEYKVWADRLGPMMLPVLKQ